MSDNSDIKSISTYLQSYYTFFVLHPLNINPSNAVASILTIRQITTKAVFLMVQDKIGINVASGQELPPEVFIPYEDSKTLRSALSMDSTILIDNVSLFRVTNLGEIFKSRSKSCRLIIFGSPTILQDDIDYIDKYCPKYKTLSYHLLNNGPILKYKLERTFLTPDQVVKYLKSQQKKSQQKKSEGKRLETNKSEHLIFSSGNKNDDYFSSLKHCNFSYPDNIDEMVWDLDRGQGGWIDKTIIQKLSQFSPKIKRLIMIILSNFDSKHVIYTQFTKKYGIDLLDTILTYLDIPHVVITDKDGYNEQYGKITTFSEPRCNNLVLLTSEILQFDVSNVTHLHFLEGTNYVVINSLIQRTNQMKMFKNFMPLEFVIHFHIASFPLNNGNDIDNGNNINYGNNINNEKDRKITLDEDLYEKVSDEIITCNNIFTKLVSSADLIGFDPKAGLCII